MTPEIEKLNELLEEIPAIRDYYRGSMFKTIETDVNRLCDAVVALAQREGMVLVPEEPTSEMLKAGESQGTVRGVWKAMLSAAKLAQSQERTTEPAAQEPRRRNEGLEARDPNGTFGRPPEEEASPVAAAPVDDLELPEEPIIYDREVGQRKRIIEMVRKSDYDSLLSLARKLKERIKYHESERDNLMLANDNLESKLAEAERLLENCHNKLAGCSTAAFGYWKEGDSLHPDYECAAVHDVASLYRRMAEAEKNGADLIAAVALAGRDRQDAERWRTTMTLVGDQCYELERRADAARKEGK